MKRLIDQYKLIPHPEGGCYREIYKSNHYVISPIISKPRRSVTHIYFLLVKNQISRFHKVAHDEIWNFYQGDPIKLITYDGIDIKEEVIGFKYGQYASIVAGGIYQSAESTGGYSFVGCTVAPGFEFEDFSLLSDDAEARQTILKDYPQYRKYI